MTRIAPVRYEGARTWMDSKWQQHRWGGPAVECSNGDKHWFWHGAWQYEETITAPWMMRRRGLARLKESNKGIFDGLRASSFDMDGKLKNLLHGYGKAKR